MFPRTLLLAVLLAACATVASATVIHVDLGGGGDYLTIGEGVAASSAGDTVLVACGTYYEFDVEVTSGIVLASETGDPNCVTVDAQQQGRVFDCEAPGNSTIVRGFTVTGGLATTGSWTDDGRTAAVHAAFKLAAAAGGIVVLRRRMEGD